jgi:glycosyltransferase involved in cell wall biosynthesis
MAFSSMNSVRAQKLSAIVPITNYFQHKSNIEKIIRDSAQMGVELILVLDRESSQAHEDLTALLKKSKGCGLVIENDSGNPGGARNAGLVCATAEWITFWDCDDEPLISKIFELILSSARTENQVLVGSYQTRSIKEKEATSQILNVDSWEIDLGLNPGIWRLVFSRNLVDNIRFPDARMGEDQIFLQRVFAKEPQVSLSKVVTYVYRTNVPNQLTGEQQNLKDLIHVNQIAIHEFDRSSKHSMIPRTMIIRQLLTLSQSASLSMLERLTYLAKSGISLARNPIIFMRLVKIAAKRILK